MYMTLLLPTLVVSPRYFRGEIELGVVTQAAIAFGKIMDAASIIVDHLGSFSSMMSEVVRLNDLLESMEQIAGDGKGRKGVCVRGRRRGGGLRGAENAGDAYGRIFISHDLGGQTMLEIRGLRIKTPYMQPLPTVAIGNAGEAGGEGGMGNESHRIRSVQRDLVRDLNLTLRRGSSLLILGPPGCGKSSLLRAVAGLWRTGAGVIRTCTQDRILFLSQKEYAAQGTLRDQLTYALAWGERALSDAEVRACLKASGLEHLTAIGGFDDRIDWGEYKHGARSLSPSHSPLPLSLGF